MASLQASSLMYSSVYAPKLCKKRSNIMATLHIPKQRPSSSNLSIPNFKNGLSTCNINVEDKVNSVVPDTVAIEKLYVILEAVSDRVEMHKNVGEQRDNWNSLLLTSINAMTLTAATMSAINTAAAATATASHMVLAPINLSSTLLYLAATGMLIIVNKIQPSQLAEEQRNAARLFQQLQNQIQRIIAIGNPTDEDVNEAFDKVLALDRAYPLPLLGVMLEKFPSNVEPAVWWPNQHDGNKNKKKKKNMSSSNGWNMNLEQEMREIIKVIRRKDKEDYLSLGRKALKLNKLLAISGPILTGLAALSSALLFTGGAGGSLNYSHGGCWAASILGILGGALATAVNSFEHGGQVGMVFEMYRSNAGFFKQMEESIESNLIEDEVERRDNGELLEMQVALQLGRSLSELRDLAASSSSSSSSMEEFASKLF